MSHPWDAALHRLYRTYREVAAAPAGVPATQPEWIAAIDRRVRGRVG